MLQISDQVHNQFIGNASKSFDLNLNEFMFEHFPEIYAMTSPEIVQEVIDKAVAAAERADFVREPDTLRFVYLWFLLGQDFDVDPQFRWLASTLHDRAIPPATRIERALELIAQRMETNQPLAEPSGPVGASLSIAARRANAS